MNKLYSAVIALGLITMIGGFTLAYGDAVDTGFALPQEGGLSASTINLSGVTDTIQELFIELIPLIAIMSILGGLLSALPKMFKFNVA